MYNLDFESMLNESMEVEVYPGKIVCGTVIDKNMYGVTVSFGYRHDGFITYSDWNPIVAPEELRKTIKIGDEVKAKVIPGSLRDDFVRLSKYKADIDAAWEKLAELTEGEKRLATVKVLRIVENKDNRIVGLEVGVEGVKGFMPASHVELQRVDDFTEYIGRELEAEIIEIDKQKKRLIVSRRDLLRDSRVNRKNNNRIKILEIIKELKSKNKKMQDLKDALNISPSDTMLFTMDQLIDLIDEISKNAIAHGRLSTMVGIAKNTSLRIEEIVRYAGISKSKQEQYVQILKQEIK